MEYTLKIKSIEIQPAKYFGPEHTVYNNNNKHARVKNKRVRKTLLINATDELGKEFFFWTPANEILTASGMLNYESMIKDGGGFWKELKGQYIGHESPFKNDRDMPTVIEDTTKVVPKVNEGDVIFISGKIAKKYGSGKVRLNYVNLIRASGISLEKTYIRYSTIMGEPDGETVVMTPEKASELNIELMKKNDIFRWVPYS